MIALLGIKKNTNLDIRGKFTISPSKHKLYTENLNELFEEVVIVATCNRTEIYINTSKSIDEEIIKKMFELLKWDFNSLRQYVFVAYEEDVVGHLMEVVCGFHSRILGEDQILGQVKDAYLSALEYSSLGTKLQRLFEEALSCGKKFRTECRIFEVPVSSVSISINKSLENNARKFMVLGYGEMGKLAARYLLSHSIEQLYIVVRNKSVVENINDNRVKVINFQEKNDYINEMDSVISCTAAIHAVIHRNEIHVEGKKILIFDLAVPRDVEPCIGRINRVDLYDIDIISSIDDKNRKIRKERMNDFRYIIDDKINEYLKWQATKELVPTIKKLKNVGDEVALERIIVFNNKCSSKEDMKLAETLIKSASHTYINKAIEVLKEESVNGTSEECLRIISKIFL